MGKVIKKDLIAPCGMNCAICAAHLRKDNPCPGCRAVVNGMPITRVNCRIKNCGFIKKKGLKYCSPKCKEFPCQKLKSLDKRYREKYGMSMIENLKSIDKNGITFFIKGEEKKWIKGNRILCVHNRRYYKIS